MTAVLLRGRLTQIAMLGAAVTLMAPVTTSMAPAVTLTTLVSFDGVNGLGPYAGLTADTVGNLYGTTVQGGANNYGTLFKLDTTGLLTTLVSFNNANGRYPWAGLTAGTPGNLYGTTREGGANGSGTVFKFDPATGALTTLASFNGANGRYPQAELTIDAAGNLYGTTFGGGANGSGAVFKLDLASGALTTLITFTGSNGRGPYTSLTADAVGNLYGTTSQGGMNNLGTIFKLSEAGFVVESAPGLPGDYNRDGRVDAADYTVWRDGLGTVYVQDDYRLWADNYGTTVVVDSQAVPEPAALVIAMFALAGCVRRQNGQTASYLSR